MKRRNGRIAAIILALIVLLAVAGALLWRAGGQEAPQEGNLLVNGDFSAVTGGMPDGWETGMWVTGAGASYLEAATADGRSAVLVENAAANDARFEQTITVRENTTYCLSALVMAEGCDGNETGANVSFLGVYGTSEDVHDTQGQWQRVSLYARTGKGQKEVTVCVRLGGYGSETTGKAWFTDVELCEADDVPLGEFTLMKNGQVDEYGFEGWTLDTMKTTGVLRSETYRVTAPTKSTVYVDGQALTDDKIIERDIPIFTVEDLPDGAHVPTDCVYEFTRYFGVDQVRVVDQYGEENALTEQGNTYTAAFNYDDSRLAPELEERVIQVVRRLSCFMTDDYSRSRLYKDLIEDSKAYSYVKRFDLNWIAKHKSYEFSNMQVNNYVSYSDDCFSAEARYDYTIIYRKADPETYPTAYRLFFKKVKDEWYLYDFTLI